MTSIKQLEQNLFNATDTLAQFYEEIESFLDILFRELGRAGYSLKGDRIRSGTFINRNLTRRLLATTNVMYFKGGGDPDETLDSEEDEEGAAEAKKAAKMEIPITRGLRIPFVSVWLFPPKAIPTVRTLLSPQLLMGAFGNLSFFEKRTGNLAKPESPALSLSNLAQLRVLPSAKVGEIVGMNCWSPKRMNRYRFKAELIEFETRRLLEIDSQQKIKHVANKLLKYCGEK